MKYVFNCSPSNVAGGFRFGPTVQQGGTGTIQQSIYLVHNNPCGNNLLIYEKLGTTGITFFQLKELLNEILKTPEVLEKFEQVRETGTAYMFSPSFKTQISYLYALMLWSKEAASFLPEIQYPGYRWRLSTFDFNGVMIYDSYTPELEIVRKLKDGKNLGFTFLPVVITFTTTPPSPIKFKNPFLAGLPILQLYGLCNNSSANRSANRKEPLSAIAMSSSFVVNQAALPEATMAVCSLLNDPANTRVFGLPGFGFSARQNTINSSLIGYHCAYLNNIYSVGEKETLIETVFIRLSLEEEPLS